MSRGVNKVILVGNLGQKPEIRYTKDSKPIASFSIATSESWKDKTTGDMVEKTEWHNVTFFGRIAEVAEQYLDKGLYLDIVLLPQQCVQKKLRYATQSFPPYLLWSCLSMTQK